VRVLRKSFHTFSQKQSSFAILCRWWILTLVRLQPAQVNNLGNWMVLFSIVIGDKWTQLIKPTEDLITPFTHHEWLNKLGKPNHIMDGPVIPRDIQTKSFTTVLSKGKYFCCSTSEQSKLLRKKYITKPWRSTRKGQINPPAKLNAKLVKKWICLWWSEAKNQKLPDIQEKLTVEYSIGVCNVQIQKVNEPP
jgi:hypothetical protein